MNDQQFMRLCFELALKAWGRVSPNPYVGAVIVKDNRIIGQGFHAGPGRPHAEIEAMQNASESVEGATLYCSLEPCCHTEKRTPPCAQRLVKENIRRVVISNLDPNPSVSGKGVALLKEAGIEVECGVLEEEGRELNEVFFKNMQTGLPFIHLKWAQTLDGKIATLSGSSKWITSPLSRERTHRERLSYDAILVGSNTLKADNPSLTVREENKVVKSVRRIVLASEDDFDPSLKFFTDDRREQSLMLLPEGKETAKNVEVVNAPAVEGRAQLRPALAKLYDLGIRSLYVEGGSGVLSQFFKENLYDRLSVFIAPKILGEGLSPIGSLGFSDIKQARLLNQVKIEMLGNDLLVTAKGNQCLQD